MVPCVVASMESPEKKNVYGQFSMSPGKKISKVTSRKSYRCKSTFWSQVLKWQNVEVSISENPKLSGQAKAWIVFERNFRSVASSQGFDHVLQDKEPVPADGIEEDQYMEDLEFVYDAFQNAWQIRWIFIWWNKIKRQKIEDRFNLMPGIPSG